MRNEKNIEQLAAQLATLGFGSEQAYNLRSNICFHPESFNLPYRLLKEGDVINFSICLQQNKDLGYNHGKLKPYKIHSRAYFLWNDIQGLMGGEGLLKSGVQHRFFVLKNIHSHNKRLHNCVTFS